MSSWKGAFWFGMMTTFVHVVIMYPLLREKPFNAVLLLAMCFMSGMAFGLWRR